MRQLWQRVTASPMLVRFVPFAIFVGLTAGQGLFGEASRYWLYGAKTLVGGALIAMMWPRVLEMRWKISGEGVLVGIVVFTLWVGLDPHYPKLGQPGTPWNPNAAYGANAALAVLFVAVRILGSTLVVPPLEEVFYRSFFYRYLMTSNFLSVPLGRFQWTAFLATAAAFGLAHPRQWLAGTLCGLAYQGLVCAKGRLGDAITAHAITNLLLGVWVAWRGAWQFW